MLHGGRTGDRPHRDIPRTLKASRDGRRKKIGANLARLRDLRNKADYDLPFPDRLDQEAKKAIMQAMFVLEELDKQRGKHIK